MAAKKARKRAYIPPSSEVVNRKERTASSRATRTHRTQASRPQQRGSAGYEYPQPSLVRTLKRLPIYFVLIFALQYWLGGDAAKDLDTQERLMLAGSSSAFVTVLFAPFMHIMDRFAYNRYLKRSGQSAPSPAPRATRDDEVIEADVVRED